MGALARGFKKDCERIVAELRAELDVGEYEAIEMTVLGHDLDIPLASLAEHIEQSSVRCDEAHLEEIYRKVSAFTIFDGYRRIIVYNERHSYVRHRSDLAHEFAHALLHHPAQESAGYECKERQYENEAAWLAGVLLLTDKQAVRLAALRASPDAAMAQYQISQEMLTYRLNVTAAFKRVGYGSSAT